MTDVLQELGLAAAAPRHRRGILASMAYYCESSARPASDKFWRARATRKGPFVAMSFTNLSATVPAVI